MYKKIISMDLDGVLNTYTGNFEKDKLSPVKEGAYEFLEDLAKDYRIEIFTVRDRELTLEWLKKNNLINFIENITDKKNPYATVILDDRAVKFEGNYNKTLNDIKTFSTYWQQ